MNLINILTYNPNLFDGIILPAGLTQEDVVNEILQECATMEPLYGDPELFHQMILHWFKTRNYTFQRLYDTMYLEYNPLENAYRTETRETDYGREYSRDTTRNSTENENTQNNGEGNTTKKFENNQEVSSTKEINGGETIDSGKDTESTQDTTSTTTASTTDKVAPYNDDNFHDTTQTNGENTAVGKVENTGKETLSETRETETSETVSETLDNSGNETSGYSENNSGNRSLSSNGTENIGDTENAKTTDKFTLKGSIGLITPQQMIEQERNIVKFNLYEYIAMEFSKRFMIQVY